MKSKLADMSSPPKINWFDDELRQLREKLLFMKQCHRASPEIIPREEINRFRNWYRFLIKSKRKNAVDRYINQAPNKNQAMWNLIKQHGGKQTNLNPTSSTLNAEKFNEFFTNIAKNTINQLPNTDSFEIDDCSDSSLSFSFRQVSFIEVRDAIDSLKNTKSWDPYSINVKILKTISNLIISPLTKLINTCIEQNEFPNSLKLAKVVPIYKKGSEEDPYNYRPISLIPIIAKIFEVLLKNQINKYFESNNLYSPVQFGYRGNTSATLAINYLSSIVNDALENHCFVFAEFHDLTKAFDCVQHNILLKKLKIYGFSKSSISLIHSYLSDRKQYVTYNGCSSKTSTIEHGVPQGSVLGPILFLIYINDLPACTSAKSILFADDTTTISTSQSCDVLLEQAESNRVELHNWFIRNKLTMNPDKTQSIVISTRPHNNVSQIDPVKFLGVLIDSKFNYQSHIRNLSKKLSTIAYLIRNLNNIASRRSVLLAYFGYFQSNCQYCILNWGHSPHLFMIFAVQRRCIRIIAGLHYRDCCKFSFIDLRILTIPCIYILECLLFVKHNLNQYTTHNNLHTYNRRNKNALVIPYNRLLKTRNGANYYSLVFYNALPECIKELEASNFKKIMKSYLIKKAFYTFDEYLNNDFIDMRK
nr:unnamed protein product [Callosobruchus chinensis]